jgi:pheromone shutdown protein TraB
VDYRDTYMSRKLIALNREYPHLLAVIGQGHMKGITSHLQRMDLDIINLKDVMRLTEKMKNGEIKIREPDEIAGNCSVSLEFEPAY